MAEKTGQDDGWMKGRDGDKTRERVPVGPVRLWDLVLGGGGQGGSVLVRVRERVRVRVRVGGRVGRAGGAL